MAGSNEDPRRWHRAIHFRLHKESNAGLLKIYLTLKKAEKVGKGRAGGVTLRSPNKLSVKEGSEVCHGVVLLHGV